MILSDMYIQKEAGLVIGGSASSFGNCGNYSALQHSPAFSQPSQAFSEQHLVLSACSHSPQHLVESALSQHLVVSSEQHSVFSHSHLSEHLLLQQVHEVAPAIMMAAAKITRIFFIAYKF